MTFVKIMSNGEYLICRRARAGSKGSTKRKNARRVFYNWFLVKCDRKINLGYLTLPKKFVGKKIMLKIVEK